MSEVKVKGQPIELAGIAYVLPPLPLVKMTAVSRLLEGGDFTKDESYVIALIDAIYWSLRRNYPEFDRSIIEENLDMSNFQTIVDAFMVSNGMNARTVEGEVLAK